MHFRDRLTELQTEEEVDLFFKNYPTCAFFKAGSCHKTMQGFGYVQQALEGRPHLHLGVVKVVDYRSASNYISQLTKVIHESPQFILLIEGRVVYDVDNWNINLSDLEEVLELHFGPAQKGKTTHLSDLSPYRNLLKAFLNEEITEEAFEKAWLKTFQSDATLRSSREFAKINSLFGDVDLAISGKQREGKALSHHSLKCRAKKLFVSLEEEHKERVGASKENVT